MSGGTPSKTSVQEANRQLSEMFRTLTEQEATFKTKLAEKDIVILALQEKVHEIQARLLAAEESLVWVRAESESKDKQIHHLTETLHRVGSVLQHANIGWAPPHRHEAAATTPSIEVENLNLSSVREGDGPLDQSSDREIQRELSVITPTTNYSIDGESDGEY